MDRYDRIFALHKRLKAARYPVANDTLEEELGCSRATLYRDIGFLRDVLHAPLLSTDSGFFYDRLQIDQFELPGLWFSSDELHALLADSLLPFAGLTLLMLGAAGWEWPSPRCIRRRRGCHRHAVW